MTDESITKGLCRMRNRDSECCRGATDIVRSDGIVAILDLDVVVSRAVVRVGEVKGRGVGDEGALHTRAISPADCIAGEVGTHERHKYIQNRSSVLQGCIQNGHACIPVAIFHTRGLTHTPCMLWNVAKNSKYLNSGQSLSFSVCVTVSIPTCA